ncbi:MAG: hypothetical protein EON93_04895 [Burkholderiales bacterium]|nr:MAG: hypothetical protein EON93_04895 [Burkholderiales bacterium]
MASALACSLVEEYSIARDALNEVESDLGSISALLADIADAIVDDPDSLAPDQLQQWPSYEALRAMIRSRKHYHDVMQATWSRMTDKERRRVGRLPPFGAFDPSRPLI